jgi:hypothetical protein
MMHGLCGQRLKLVTSQTDVAASRVRASSRGLERACSAAACGDFGALGMGAASDDSHRRRRIHRRSGEPTPAGIVSQDFFRAHPGASLLYSGEPTQSD